ADIYADHGDRAVEALGHGVLLCLWSPLPDSSLAGQEHGRTIPLADIRPAQIFLTATRGFFPGRVDLGGGIRGDSAGPAERLHQSSDAVVCFALQSLGLVGIH